MYREVIFYIERDMPFAHVFYMFLIAFELYITNLESLWTKISNKLKRNTKVYKIKRDTKV